MSNSPKDVCACGHERFHHTGKNGEPSHCQADWSMHRNYTYPDDPCDCIGFTLFLTESEEDDIAISDIHGRHKGKSR
jgi:hypothetical protein